VHDAVDEQRGVPSTWPDARPLSTSRWIRSSTAALSRFLFLVCTDRAATVIVPVTSPAADMCHSR
jgi:hypothetical protein